MRLIVCDVLQLRVKSFIRLSPARQLRLLHARWQKTQVLSERHKRQKLHAASFSSSWLWRSEEGWGLPWQHPCWWQGGWREWEENLYNYNLFWGGGDLRGGGGQALQMPLDAHRLSACCVKSVPLHLTPRPSHSLCDIEREGTICGVSCTPHICSDWLQLQCFMESLPWVKRWKKDSWNQQDKIKTKTKAKYREDGLHNEKLSEDVISCNDCHF